MLLQFVADNLDKLDINQKVLRETVRAFHLTNEEFASKPVAHSEDYQLCVASCKVRHSAECRTNFFVAFVAVCLKGVDAKPV